MNGPTPYLLGRPILFEIMEAEQPEAGVACRWLVVFHVADLASHVFELKDEMETRSDGTLMERRPYRLHENGMPCGFDEWHLSLETARNSVVAMVENHVRNSLPRQASLRQDSPGQDSPGQNSLSQDSLSQDSLSRDPHKLSDRITILERHLTSGFLNPLSSPGLAVLHLFGARHASEGLAG
jgi:hypothetical protein